MLEIVGHSYIEIVGHSFIVHTYINCATFCLYVQFNSIQFITLKCTMPHAHGTRTQCGPMKHSIYVQRFPTRQECP